MKTKQNKNWKKFSSICTTYVSGAMACLIIVSCAKDKPYETVYKEPELVKKAESVDTESLFLYVPSTLGAPKDIQDANAFFQGDAKVVKFKFTEKSLDVIEVERDARFAGNDLNSTPVLSIPVDYKEFRCTTNSTTGECENKEEENTEIEWNDKSFFKPDFASLDVKEVNSLDLFSIDSSCVSEVGSGLVNYEMNKNVLNIEIEKTFKVSTSFECIAPLYFQDKLGKAGFKMRFLYSIVKLDSLVSPSYKTVDYPIQDQSDFGFFRTTESKLNDDFDSSRPINKTFLHRWNPEKKQIVYYLSEAFNKSENKYLKDATYVTFDKINNGLREANTEVQLVLEEPKSGLITGDLRFNTINLIDEPLANGLLGYGPTVANPITGEIIHGNVNMYSGVLLSTVRSTYESMVDLSLKNVQKISDTITKLKISNKKNDKATNTPSEGTDNASADITTKPVDGQYTSKTIANSFSNNSNELKTKLASYNKNIKAFLKQHNDDLNKAALNSALKASKEPYDKGDIEAVEHRRFINHGKQGACSQELISTPDLAKKIFPEVEAIEGIKNDNGTLKEWDNLGESLQKLVIKAIMPKVYTGTLIHEMGHNLGLRHNFTGSYDKENFYTQKEAEERGMHTVPTYSSIMDYGYSELNALDNAFGKYDVAALRFAYAREVQTNDGKFVTINNNLVETKKEIGQKNLKSFLFCTDENVGLNIPCNPFDEGTNNVELALHHISKYEDLYKYRNFRNGRAEFSTYDTDYAVYSRSRSFKSARLIFEGYDLFVEIFGRDFMERGCSNDDHASYPDICREIDDRIISSKLVAKMFLDILKTPDLTCAVSNASKPTEIKELVKLASFIDNSSLYSLEYTPSSCFDQNVVSEFAKQGLVVHSEVGKFFNDMKEKNPIYPYSSDISIRGIWFDKLIAMKMLTMRYTGNNSTESGHGALSDINSVSNELMNYISHIITGEQLSAPIPFKDQAGNLFQIDYSIDSSYIIPEQATRFTIRSFNLPAYSNVEQIKEEMMMAALFNGTTDITYKPIAQSFNNIIGVHKKSESDSFESNNIITLELDGDIYGATPKNVIAKMMIEAINSIDLLKSVAPDFIVKVYYIKNNSFDIPEDFSEVEATATTLQISLLEELAGLKQQGFELTEEVAISVLGEKVGKKAFSVYSQLSIEQFVKVIDFVNKESAIPENATEAEKQIYTLDEQILEDFLMGKLEDKIELYTKTIKFLPAL